MSKKDRMSAEEFRALVSNSQVPVEHRALWALLWDGDLRLGDALSVDVRDVDLEEQRVRVEVPVRDPGPRSVPMSAESAQLVREVIGSRTEGLLLVNASGRAISREAAARWARITGRGVHDFRFGGRFEPQPHKFE
jgi:integrase